jgi:hypothetical protein
MPRVWCLVFGVWWGALWLILIGHKSIVSQVSMHGIMHTTLNGEVAASEKFMGRLGLASHQQKDDAHRI